MPTLEKFLKQAQEHAKENAHIPMAKREMDCCVLELSQWFRSYDSLMSTSKKENEVGWTGVKTNFGRLLTRQFRAIYALGFTVQECLEAAEENNMEED